MHLDALYESQEQRYKQKCRELKLRIAELEESNEVASIALSRTKSATRKLRVEYALLIERLEDRVIQVPNGNFEEEEVTPPPSPSILDESLNNVDTKLTRNGISRKGKRSRVNAGSSGASASLAKIQKIRDPDLPKRPTNAYLIFCEMEKDKIRKELQDSGIGADVSKSLTEAWKSLNDEERRPYYKLYEDDRERYQREMTIYNKRKLTDEPKVLIPQKTRETTPSLQATGNATGDDSDPNDQETNDGSVEIAPESHTEEQ